MQTGFNFIINNNGEISKCFIDKGIHDFKAAVQFISSLPYGRNENKKNLSTIFKDNCGTCSTKHAVLKQLAIENNVENIRLMLVMFKMNSSNTPKVQKQLSLHNLPYIPEAHNFLLIDGHITDCTTTTSSASNFINDIIEETEITPEQITDFKVSFHKNYLEKWLKENNEIRLSLEELWTIREACIADLSM